ncbi:MAG: transglycosylase SLT domain-containing protein [Bdellovibrionales bacterium]|nr:transglycosylase SLT domain-containing protein [Bdellovibrionales bacterium]
MILFQKIYKRLFILWIAFFCPLAFSNPFMFNPMLFAPHPLPSQVILPQNTPLMPLCPQGVSIQLCLALNSFPLVEVPPHNNPSATMYTPFSHKSKDISSKRRKRLLSRYKWKSYEYSDDDNTLKSLPETERNVEPEGNYYRVHIQETPEENSPAQVIQEERANGQHRNSVGELRGIQTEEILRIVESTPTQQAPETQEEREAPQRSKRSSTPQQTPKPQTEENRQIAQPIILDRPVTTIALNYNNIPKQCSDLKSGDTEAISICVDCAQRTNDQIQRDSAETLQNADLNTSFNSYLLRKLEGKICHGKNIIEPIKNNFENTCGNISFENYMSDVLICESCKHNIPPALMLSMMSLESSGTCFTPGDDGDSHGLFQINIKYHKDPPVCSSQQKAKLQTASLTELKTGLQCLGNPVANIRKSIEILKSSYRSVNGSQSNVDCQSPNMNTQQTDKWRKALAGYNGGPTHIDRLKNMQKPQAIPQSQWNKMDEWQKIRVQYFFYKGVKPNVRMRNLAHTETALGSSGDSRDQLNLFNSWNKAIGDTVDQSQCNE